MTLLDVAGSPAKISNKTPFPSNSMPKWSVKTLESLSFAVNYEILEKDEFDKLDNPFLNGLKKISKNDLVFCKKCDDLVKVSPNGIVRNTFQFDCKKDGHHLSATQILGTLPDEWITSSTELMCDSTRLQTLKWIDKEHLAGDIWETKGLKNATKRFAVELSPIKTNDTKIRAVNVSLETEVKELKVMVETLMKRQDVIESENVDLRSALKAAREEASMLRRLLAEETPKSESRSQPSFAEVAVINRPIKKPTKAMSPLETVSPKSISSVETDVERPAFSPLKIVFYEGCHRKSPSTYRQMFRDIGIDPRAIRDITFLADDLLQLTTYESAISDITAALKSVSEKIRRIDDFDPTKAESYSKYGSFNDEEVKNSYFAVMAKSAERLKKAAENVKALKRSANFLNKIVENRNIEYKPVEKPSKIFFLGNLLSYANLNTKNIEMEPEQMGGVEQSAPSV